MLRIATLVAALAAAAVTAAATTVTGSGGTQRFEAPPERVVALSWSLAEQVIALGVTPLAIADPAGYRTWVARPALPQEVIDVGLRQEPNLERIAELDPHVILISDDQRSFAPALERIAPVVHFDTFRADHDNQAAARRTLRELARLFGREERAERELAALDARLAALRDRVHAHLAPALPKVSVVVYGANSMPAFALEALGLENGVELPPSKWGIAMRKVEELGRIAAGEVLWIEPFAQREALFSRPLWQAMPFVREGRLHALPPTWTYGGALSVGYLAQAIVEALIAAEGS